MSHKIVIKYECLQSWEMSSYVSLIEFDFAKSNLRLSPWPKVKFKKDLLNIFHFTLSFFQALFKRCINDKLKVTLVIFTSYSIALYYIQFNETFLDHGGSKP